MHLSGFTQARPSRMRGNTIKPCMANPASTVTRYRASALRRWVMAQADRIVLAMSEAMPMGVK